MLLLFFKKKRDSSSLNAAHNFLVTIPANTFELHHQQNLVLEVCYVNCILRRGIAC